MKQKITCYCGEENEAEFQDVYDANSDETVVSSIIEGTFMSFECKKCGKLLKPELSCVVNMQAKDRDIQFLPELERNAFYRDGIGSAMPWRVVIGFSELEEKVRIVMDNLDDQVIEIIKFRLLEKAVGNDVKIYYRGIENNHLVFHLHGLKDDEIGVSKIPLSAYEALQGSLESFSSDDEYGIIVQPPYVSINKVYFEE